MFCICGRFSNYVRKTSFITLTQLPQKHCGKNDFHRGTGGVSYVTALPSPLATIKRQFSFEKSSLVKISIIFNGPGMTTIRAKVFKSHAREKILLAGYVMTQSIEVLPSVRIQSQANKKRGKVACVNKVLIGKFFLFHLDFKKSISLHSFRLPLLTQLIYLKSSAICKNRFELFTVLRLRSR